MRINDYLALLGLKVQDKVTDYEGVVTSVSFDLYGCIQAVVNPGLDKDGKPKETYWFDVTRLKVVNNIPIMDVPNFVDEGIIS